MKNVMKRLMVCGLCVSMLVGCGTSTDTSKTGTGKKNIEVGNLAGNGQEDNMSELNSIIELKAKYEDQEKYEYTDPMYNLEKNHVFTYDVGEAFFKSEEYEAFKVYSDSNFQNTVNIKIEDNYDDDKITISPSLVFSYENEEDSRTDGTWGSRSKFWLVQYMDTKTGKELDKPIVTVFSIAQELNTPTMKQSVGGDGYYKLSWSKVDGADYYEVYEYDKGLDYASLAVTTENLECSNADFAHVKKYEEEFKEEYRDTEIDVDTQMTMNHFLDSGDSFFVVAKTNDGKHSGMSNECDPQEIANQIPISQSWDFQTDYTGTDALALPAYVDIEMMDGSIGKYVIEYRGGTATLYDDGTIAVDASIKNLPIAMYRVRLTGVDYDTFMAQTKNLIQRGDELAGRTGSANENIDIPFVPDSQETPEDESGDDDADVDEENINDNTDVDENGTGDTDVEDENGNDDTDVEDENDNGDTDVDENGNDDTDVEDESGDDVGGETVNVAGVELPENVAKTVYANSSLSEWLALNFLAQNETISLDGFKEASDSEKLGDAFIEAYRQNPLCGIINNLEYDYDKNEFVVEYAQTKEETQNMQQECLKKAKDVAGEIIQDGMSDYEKEQAINQYLCDNAEYNYDVMNYEAEDGSIGDEAVEKYPNSFTPYGILVENFGVCESYAEAFHLVANEAGLQSIMVVGTLEGGGHEWNRVLLNGKWYTLDVTNNDKEVAANALFNISDEVAAEILKESDVCILDDYAGEYKADDMKYEYYTVNGLVAEDTEQAKKVLIDGLKKDGNTSVRMEESLSTDALEELVQQVVNEADVEQVSYVQFGRVVGITIATE
ncbi:MAG: hypothetical protein GX284_08350 [Clostridiales bacterium]|nr:hypothetical protein [Clostridiales bacterium]